MIELKYSMDELEEIIKKVLEYVDPETNIIALSSADICVLAGLDEFDADLIDLLVNLVLDKSPILLQVKHALMEFFILNPKFNAVKDKTVPFLNLFDVNMYERVNKDEES